MTAIGRPARPRRWSLRASATLRRWWSRGRAAAGSPGGGPTAAVPGAARTAAARRAREQPAGAAAPGTHTPGRGRTRRGPLPLHEALAIGLGCDLGRVERHTRRDRDRGGAR